MLWAYLKRWTSRIIRGQNPSPKMERKGCVLYGGVKNILKNNYLIEKKWD